MVGFRIIYTLISQKRVLTENWKLETTSHLAFDENKNDPHEQDQISDKQEKQVW